MTKNPVHIKKSKSLNIDSPLHVTGRTKYVDDLSELAGTLYAKTYYSKIAHGTITHLDYTKAEQMPGVIKVLSYKDIPGENQVGGIIQDEPLLAEKEVHFIGQPILLIIAKNDIVTHKALELIDIKIKPKKIIVDPKEAQQAGELLVSPRRLKLGNPKNAFAKCDYIFEGTAESGGQEHVYLETQGAYAVPARKW